MNTAIVITLIICGTLIALSIISNVSKANERKSVNKRIEQFKKAFPNLKDLEKRDQSDDFPKFWD